MDEEDLCDLVDNFVDILRAGVLVAAGLKEVTVQTFVGDMLAPLNEGERIAFAALFKMLWVEPAPCVSPEAWREYQRLCEPASPDFILNEPGYYTFFTYTVFRGIVPDEK
jgi:hypothetical protein